MDRGHDAGVERIGGTRPTGSARSRWPGRCWRPRLSAYVAANFINSSINTLPEHEGLGRISRAEKVAAAASIARRTRQCTFAPRPAFAEPSARNRPGARQGGFNTHD